MPSFHARRERLGQIAEQEGVDGLLITNPLNVTYLTGFTGDSAHLILRKNGTLLISDARYSEQIAEECSGLDVHIRPPSQTLIQATCQQIGQLGVRSLGFESAHLTVSDFDALRAENPSLDWRPAANRVELLRMVKDADELAEIRLAIDHAEQAFKLLRKNLRPDHTEKQLVDQMENLVRGSGGKCTAFPTIIAVGERAALPHAPPTEKRVEESFLLLVDWGAHARLYKSDLTRILWSRNNAAFSASDESKLRRIHTVLCEAQRRAIASMRPGAKTSAVDAAARGYIAEEGFGEYFTHGLGHGFGLQIHEPPFLRPNLELELQAGMVVTCEPGIYVPGWGGVRVEDDILITPDGAEILTNYPREFDESEW